MGSAEVTIVLAAGGKQTHRGTILTCWSSWRLGVFEVGGRLVVQVCGRLVPVIGRRVTVHGGMCGAFTSRLHSRAATVSMRQVVRYGTAELVSRLPVLRQRVWQV